MHIRVECYGPSKFTIAAENLVLKELQFRKISVCRELPGWVGIGYHKPISASWWINSMIVLKRSLLEREET